MGIVRNRQQDVWQDKVCVYIAKGRVLSLPCFLVPMIHFHCRVSQRLHGGVETKKKQLACVHACVAPMIRSRQIDPLISQKDC